MATGGGAGISFDGFPMIGPAAVVGPVPSLTSSEPSGKVGWSATATEPHTTYTGSWTLHVNAICVDAPR